MTPWTCRATLRVLEAYHDGELPVDQQVAVQSHLRHCRSCAAERHWLRETGEGLREAAMLHVPVDAEAVGRNVLARMPDAERSITRRVIAAFDDMRLVWPALGATVATLACLAAGFGFMRQALREQPTSMAALITALADPGSNQNPLSLDGRILLPQAVPAEFMGSPVVDREDALFALAAVVTREGRVSNLELLLQDSGHSPVGPRAIVDLLDAASQMRFEPARAGGSPVAVNMVWLLAQTKVRPRVASPAIVRPRVPTPRPVTPQAAIPSRPIVPVVV
jgi:putative zinc finger protein